MVIILLKDTENFEKLRAFLLIFFIRYLWDAMGNVHFSGENLSFAPGWIQGALESGLKSAYQVYARYRQRKTPETKA